MWSTVVLPILLEAYLVVCPLVLSLLVQVESLFRILVVEVNMHSDHLDVAREMGHLAALRNMVAVVYLIREQPDRHILVPRLPMGKLGSSPEEHPGY